MSIPANIPQITILRSEVEKVLGTPVRTHDGFLSLVSAIESALCEHLSESTLERLWGYSTRKTNAISVRTLDVLAKYVGASSWEDFCKRLKDESLIESEELEGNSIMTDSLPVGSVIHLGWLPDRMIRIEYKGANEFVIIESGNSTLNPGDTFKCMQFQKGYPLYLDCFRRAGEVELHRFVVGERNGLTLLEIE